MRNRRLWRAVGLVGWLLALPAWGKDFSLTEQPWKLKPFAGEPDSAWLEFSYDDSSWISQKLPAQWQMLPQFEEKYGGQMMSRQKFDFIKRWRCGVARTSRPGPMGRRTLKPWTRP